MNKTITISIGNTDNKLTQQEWSIYCQSANYFIRTIADKVYFYGFSNGDAPYQNAAWIISIQEEYIPAMNQTLSGVCKIYKQESIVVIIGDTLFIN